MESSREEDCCSCCSSNCCSWCLRGCLHGSQKRKYADVKYELVPRPQPGQHRAFVHQQQPNPAVVLPQDLQRALEPSQPHGGHQFIVTRQPKGSSSPQYSPHRRLVETNGSPSPTSSLSEEFATPALNKLRSRARSPDHGKSDTIDISQSPTRTFSSAYQRSQKRRSYAASTTTASSRRSTARTSSSEEGETDTTPSSQEKTASSKTDSFASEPDPHPILQLSLYYHVESECLSVCLHGAQNLPPKRSKNYSLVLHLAPEKTDTLEMKIVGDDPSPSLAQSFEIPNVARDNVRQYKLVIRLHDGSSTGELLGNTTVALDKTDLFGMMFAVLLDAVSHKPKGELLISLSLNPKTSVLQGILLKLTNSVIATERTGLPDVYVKVYLVHKEKRNKHWKSSTRQSNLSLIFNEAFQFDLRHKDARHASLEVCVMSYDRFSRDEELGRMVIGEEAGDHETGRQHWRQIIAQPQARISHWHAFSLSGTS